MRGDPAFFCALFAAGVLLAVPLIYLRLLAPDPSLIRVNFRGKEVPAVLGYPVVVTGLVGLAILALAEGAGWGVGSSGQVVLAVLVILVVFGVAGAWDDRKGDERPRGFKGHLGALSTGKVTGGLVKLTAGGLAGLAAGWLVWEEVIPAAQTGLIVALAANLVNLFDRAPGRAAKISILTALPLALLGHGGWALAAASTLGALVTVLPFDLRERGMLGDTGANPLGALLGLGIALSCGSAGRWVALGLLVALNAASERWSFSSAIDRTPALRFIDRLGRPEHEPIARKNPPE